MSSSDDMNFTVSDAAKIGRRDGVDEKEFSRDRPPVYLIGAKSYFESRIKALDSSLVAIANRTTDRGEESTSESYYKEKERLLSEWRAVNHAHHDEHLEQIKLENFDPSVFDYELETSRKRLDELRNDYDVRKNQWMEVEHGRPQFVGWVKWLVIFFFAIAEIVANLDWLNGLLADVDSPFPISPKYFIMVVAFVVSLGLMIIGEKSGEDLRQRNYGQLSWKLLALVCAGSTIAYYRDHALAVAAATNAEGELDKTAIEFDPSRFGVSLAIFVIFTAIALIVGYYSSHSSPEFKTRRDAFNQIKDEVTLQEDEISSLLERKQSSLAAYQVTKVKRIEDLKADLVQRERVEDARIDMLLEEKHPFGFFRRFARMQNELESIRQEFFKVCAAYIGAYNSECSDSGLPADLVNLHVPERLAVDNPDPADFRAVSS